MICFAVTRSCPTLYNLMNCSTQASCPSPPPGVFLRLPWAARWSLRHRAEQPHGQVSVSLWAQGWQRQRAMVLPTCPVFSALCSESRPVPLTTYIGPSAPVGFEPRDPTSLRQKVSGGKSDSRKFQKAKLKFAVLATVYVAFTLYYVLWII